MAVVDFDTETNSLYLLNNYYQSTASEGAEDFEFVEPMVFDMVIWLRHHIKLPCLF